MNTLLLDLRFGARMLIRQPGFTAVAVLTLAIGIGATTTIFSFVNGILLKPLPYRDSGRLVAVQPLPQRSTAPVSASPGDFLDWQTENRCFEEMAAFTVTPVNVTGDGEPVRVWAAMVSARFAELAGVSPQIGRTLADAATGADSTPVLISDRLWRQRFEADPRIVGRSIALDGAAHVIVGVMPPRFAFPAEMMRRGGGRPVPDTDVWLRQTLRPAYRANAFLQVAARLKPGVTIDQARAEMNAIEAGLAERFPEDRNTAIVVTPLREHMVGGVRPLLLTLFGAVGLLLAIACANVANLLVGHAASRSREAAIRSALGSGRRRLVQQHITESLLLGIIGGAAGLLVAVWGLDLVTALVPHGALPRLAEVHIDRGVLAFSTALAVVCGVVFGVAPARHAANADIMIALKGTTSSQTARLRSLNMLVVAQVALAFVLIAGSALLARSFWRLTSVDPGFEAARVLAADVTLPDGSYRGLVEERRFASAVVERLQQTAGVGEAGAVNLLPIGGSLVSGDFTVEGVARPRGFVAVKPSVSPGYFRAMGVPLLRGRAFDARDTADAPGVAIVNERFARQMWPGQEGIGRRLKLGFGPVAQQPWLTVAGVVADIKQTALSDAARPAIYVPIAQAPLPFLLRELSFVVRTTGDPAIVAPSIRAQIRAVDPGLPVARVATMTNLIADSVSEPRFRAVLVGAFATAAVALITIGMLGVLGYAVARRTREIGVRMALGADRVDVVRMVVKQAMTLTFVGIVAGAALAYPMTRVLGQFLFEISPHDPAAFIGAAVALLLLALLASYVPVRRATTVDPLIALRAE